MQPAPGCRRRPVGCASGKSSDLLVLALVGALLAAVRVGAQVPVTIGGRTYRVTALGGNYSADVARYRLQPWFTWSDNPKTNNTRARNYAGAVRNSS